MVWYNGKGRAYTYVKGVGGMRSVSERLTWSYEGYSPRSGRGVFAFVYERIGLVLWWEIRGKLQDRIWSIEGVNLSVGDNLERLGV